MTNFLAWVYTPGGHILVCLFLIVIGVALYALKIPKGDEVITGAVAVLYAAMKGRSGDGK